MASCCRMFPCTLNPIKGTNGHVQVNTLLVNWPLAIIAGWNLVR